MPRSSDFQLSRSIRGSRLLKAIVALTAVLCALLVAGPKFGASPARADGPPAGYICVYDTYSNQPGDGTLGCPAHEYPVFQNGGQVVNYLAMGDSYSSGEGVPAYVGGSSVYDNPSNDNCDRSYAAASAVLEQDMPLILGVEQQIDRQFIACSGAVTKNLDTTSGQNGELSQSDEQTGIEAVLGQPDLVTLTIGGNDIGFKDIVQNCITWHALNVVTLGAYPSCSQQPLYIQGVTLGIQVAELEIEHAYRTIAGKAGPNASILVSDYPQIFPASGAAQSCPGLAPFFSPQDENTLREWTTLLDATIAEAARNAGVHLVDVSKSSGVFGGHEICGAKGSWINELVGRNGQFPGVVGAFHPTAKGQAAYGLAYAKYIEAWRKGGNPLNSAGFPLDSAPTPAPPGVSLRTGGGASAAHVHIETADDSSSSTLGQGDLTVEATDPAACQSQFAAGESVHVTGDGFAPDAAVTLTLMSGLPEATTYPVTADDSGAIDTTLVLPATLVGSQIGSADLGWIQSDGPGATTTDQWDNALFPIGDESPGCGGPVLTGAQASVELLGNDSPDLSLSGARFAIDGPGLPATAGAAAGTFAELDTDANELTTCVAQEPAGVQCADGVIGGLTPDASYTVTQLQAPSGYAVAAPVTVTAADDGTVAEAAFTDTAVAADYESGTTSASCLLCVLSGTGTSLSATGNSRITWAGIGTSNSTSVTATTATGSSILTGQAFFNSGGVKLTGTSHLNTATPPTAGSTQDPFFWYHLPTQSGTGAALSATGSQVVDAHPGVYSKITASGNARLTLEPGTYVVTGGGVSVSGSAKLTASGATIYLACSGYPSPCSGSAGSGVAISGAAVVSLTGGAVGPGDGFALLADPADAAAMTVAGSASLTVDGTVEAPAESLTVSGSATVASTGGEVVLSTVAVSGSASVDVEGDPLPDL
jgi:lysophospholipase L1-like esterase